MEVAAILGTVLAVVLGGLAFLYFRFLGAQTKQAEISGLMSSAPMPGAPGRRGDLDIEEIKRASSQKLEAEHVRKEDISSKLFKAGYFSPEARRNFRTAQMICPIIGCILCLGFMLWIGSNALLTTSGAILGLFIGVTAPSSWLERKIRARQEEIMYYLPLVIEQIAIGVSSSLDIGPCVSTVVAMARERDSHNPVTEMFAHVEKLIRSGLSLEEALVEVAEANGMTELKHAFTFLAQCSKHGGEVSKQLQELGDAVMVQRQTQIEGKIAALPVLATGPLMFVFAGFFFMIGAGLFVKVMGAFDAM